MEIMSYNITNSRYFTCCKIFWRCISVSTHDSSRDMTLVTGWPISGQPKVRKFGIIILQIERKWNNLVITYQIHRVHPWKNCSWLKSNTYCIKKNIRSLKVTVYDFRFCAMKKCKTLGSAKGYLHSQRPREWLKMRPPCKNGTISQLRI